MFRALTVSEVVRCMYAEPAAGPSEERHEDFSSSLHLLESLESKPPVIYGGYRGFDLSLAYQYITQNGRKGGTGCQVWRISPPL